MTKEEQDDLLRELMHKLLRQDKAYSLDGTPTLTVKLNDGTFRKKPAALTEYFPSDAYTGSREINFCFTPEDPQEGWAHIEIAARNLDDVMPTFLEDAQGWAKAKFMSGDASRGVIIDAQKSVVALLDKIFIFAAEDEKRALEGDDSELTALPNFGMF